MNSLMVRKRSKVNPAKIVELATDDHDPTGKSQITSEDFEAMIAEFENWLAVRSGYLN